MSDGTNGGRVAATFGARPKILIQINDLDDDVLDDFDDEIEFTGARWIRRGCQHGEVILDVDAAENAIVWLKAHGVATDAAALGLPVSPEVPRCRPITFTVEFANSILSIIDNLDVDGLRKDECTTLDELADVLKRARVK